MATQPEALAPPLWARTRQILLRVLTRPLNLPSFLLLVVGLAAAATLYCIIYCLIAFTLLDQGRMPLSVSLAWGFSATAPWLICFELCKRARSLPPMRGLLAIATSFIGVGFVSIIFDVGLGDLLSFARTPLLTELARVLPKVVVTAAMVAVSRSLPLVAAGEETDAGEDLRSLMNTAGDIEWVKAAGNYVEVRQNGRTKLHRVTMQRLEQELPPQRFIRIHRGVIVNADFIESRLGGGASAALRLRDGTVFKVGGRYSGNLAAVTS